MTQSQDFDLVDIGLINPRIRVEIRDLHSGRCGSKCFLRRKVALKLDLVQKKLEKIGMGLKIWSGYRPFSSKKNSLQTTTSYHRGAAVDLTLVDQEGKELKMPTGFDDFSKKAALEYQRLPKEVLYNRTLLVNIMEENGFVPEQDRWWHFEDCEGAQYPVEDLLLEGLEG